MTVTTNDPEIERGEILRLDNEWTAAAADGRDIERVLSFWSDDATVFSPGAPAIVGKAAIRQFITSGYRTPGFSVSWKTIQLTVSPAGDFAYGVGPNRFTYPGADGKLVTAHGKAVTIWRKDPSGWKCVIDIWNDDPSVVSGSVV